MTAGKTLRFFRIALQAVALTLLTLCFVGVPSALLAAAHLSVDIQLVPAVVSLSLGTFLTWIIITLLLGRVYCSTVCPLGTVQDIVAATRRHRRYRFRRSSAPWSVGVLVVVLLASVLGYPVVLQLLDPYSAYGRMVGSIAYPSLVGCVVAAVTFAVVAVMAWRGGRRYCNTICPVGGGLQLVSRISVFRIQIDPDKCVRCGRCADRCKSECIDIAQSTVDTARCVACFNCLTDCPNDAIHYTTDRKQLATPMFQPTERRRGAVTAATPTPAAADNTRSEVTRRDFLSITAALAAGSLLSGCRRTADKILTATDPTGAIPIGRLTPVAPPGALSRKLFLDRCTGCSLCTSRCPSGVLRPAAGQLGPSHPLTPVMDYDSSHCLYDCNLCTTLCPTGALQPLELKEKQLEAIGMAQTVLQNCVHCGMCARVCPTHAIEMVDSPRGARPVPKVDPARCIGCGACQNVCPASPYKAIVVSGMPD